MATAKKETAETISDPSKLFSVSEEETEVLRLALMAPTANVRYDRKINMGNYESLGVGISVSMPIGLTPEQYATYAEMAKRAIDEANKISASETNQKVARIKARQRGEESDA